MAGTGRVARLERRLNRLEKQLKDVCADTEEAYISGLTVEGLLTEKGIATEEELDRMKLAMELSRALHLAKSQEDHKRGV